MRIRRGDGVAFSFASPLRIVGDCGINFRARLASSRCGMEEGIQQARRTVQAGKHEILRSI